MKIKVCAMCAAVFAQARPNQAYCSPCNIQRMRDYRQTRKLHAVIYCDVHKLKFEPISHRLRCRECHSEGVQRARIAQSEGAMKAKKPMADCRRFEPVELQYIHLCAPVAKMRWA
jgi:hypothetical protein